jgi:hypothetical protein
LKPHRLKVLALNLVSRRIGEKRLSLKVVSGLALASQKKWRARCRRPQGCWTAESQNPKSSNAQR